VFLKAGFAEKHCKKSNSRVFTENQAIVGCKKRLIQ
jgi:hypothetical protein